MKYRIVTVSNSGKSGESHEVDAKDDVDASVRAGNLVFMTSKKVSQIIKVEAGVETVVWDRGNRKGGK